MVHRQAIISCPLCQWRYEIKPLDPRLNADTLASVFGPGIMFQTALNRQTEETEKALREHFSGHKIEEWVRKVTEQASEIERLRGVTIVE